MEELVNSLEGSFHVTKEPNSTACAHPRFSQFKQKRSNSDQECRRKNLLEKQRSNRLDYLNLVRKLTDNDWTNDPGETNEEEEEESMDVQQEALKKPGRYYKDQLMLSEWLVEVPEDFKTEWVTVLCPVAKRCLVIASRGKTSVYTKSGYCINRFPSGLPGGHFRTSHSGGTILDCLYNEAARTYYVLDLMCWNGHPVYDSETEFRFYWLHEKFKEFTSLKEISKSNPYMFVPIPSFDCEASTLKEALEVATFEIDGLLFYHKRSHYTFGSTPLVVWLKPYMVPEILGITVPQNQMQGLPDGYTNYADHMKLVEKTREINKQKELKQGPKAKAWRGRGKRKSRNVEMKEATSEGNEKEVSGEEVEQTVEGNCVDVETENMAEDCVNVQQM